MTRRENLQDWQWFVRTESHILKEHPELIWQQGANQPKNSAVSRHAALLEKSDLWIRSPWLRWINKPEERSPCLQTLNGHSGPVNAVALIPGSGWAVSASHDRTLKLWDIETGEELRTFKGHRDVVKAVAVTTDGRTIVSYGNDETVKVWSVESGRTLPTYKERKGYVIPLAMFPDGQRIVSGSFDAKFKIWEISTGHELLILHDQREGAMAVAVTPDSRHIISGDQYGNLILWDAQTGLNIRALNYRNGYVVDKNGYAVDKGGRVHTFWVSAIAVDPNGRFIALTAGGQGAIKILDLSTLEELRSWIGHPDGVCDLAVTFDGARIVSAGHDSTVKVWDAESGKELQTLCGHGGSVLAVSVTPDGRRAVSASDDGTLKVWDIESSKSLRFPEHSRNDDIGKWHKLGVSGLATLDSRRIVSSGASTVKIWNIQSGQQIPASLLSIPTRELAEGLQVTERTFLPHVVECIAVTPDGQRVITGGTDHAVIIWDITSGKKLYTLRGHMDSVNAVAVTPDGKHIVSAGDYCVGIWDAHSGKKLRTLKGHFDIIQAVVVTPDGRRIVSGGWDGLRIWDADTGLELPTPRWPLYEVLKQKGLPASKANIPPILVLVASPNGEFLVSGNDDGNIHFWNTDKGEEIRSFGGHKGRVAALAVTPDCRYIVSGGWDKWLKVWSIDNSTLLAHFLLPSESTSIVALSNLIFAGDSSGRVHMLELCGVNPGMGIVTAHINKGQNSYRCVHCLKVIPAAVGDLGHEVTCLECGARMRLNAFVLTEQTRPWWRFWR